MSTAKNAFFLTSARGVGLFHKSTVPTNTNTTNKYLLCTVLHFFFQKRIKSKKTKKSALQLCYDVLYIPFKIWIVQHFSLNKADGIDDGGMILFVKQLCDAVL